MARPRSRLTWVTVLTKLSGEFESLNEPEVAAASAVRAISSRSLTNYCSGMPIVFTCAAQLVISAGRNF